MPTFVALINTLLIISLAAKSSHGLSCLSETGSPVDWFIVYKIPKLETSSIRTVKSGLGYSYITDKSTNDWTLSSTDVSDEDSIFGRTISPVIDSIKKSKKSSSDLSYLAYSDQSPDSQSSSGAHAKGLFAMDSSGGFWLSHSVPRFPDLNKKYSFPDSGRSNGQTAICISLAAGDTKNLDNIAYQLLVMRPKIYSKRLADSFLQKSENWNNLNDERWVKDDPSSELTITSKKGLTFTSFSKSTKYTKDLYSGLIANHFKENLLVQSWRNGAGEKLESDCTDKYKVQNVDRIGIKSFKGDWNATEDHSKWGITSDSNGFTCIADINRMRSQFRRGGGSLCIHSEKVWNVFKKSIEAVEGCPMKGSNKGSKSQSSDSDSKSSSKSKSRRTNSG